MGKQVEIRKVWSQIDETRSVSGRGDEGGPLYKVAVCGVVSNPLAGLGYVCDLGPLIDASAGLAAVLGKRAVALLGTPVMSYGKGAIAGLAGEQEHANAMLTSVFGDKFRETVGGGAAWITSSTKVGGPGCAIDVPLAFKDDIWVRSHYDAVEIRVPDAPLPEEILVIVAVASRGRLNARLGGRAVGQGSVPSQT